ncbi:hypothetical protein EHS25_007899 [Saitozyma podzolica]|uniref:Uncharacterized protein n=1 Tax=Saitozyma podzolica TaxID=1890683 RepID=A0A427YR31_9TREE|nr:hypothetical protein EHS25_007899 [Saitozyma podzolica]
MFVPAPAASTQTDFPKPPQQLEIAEQDSDAELEAALPELEADDDEFNAAPIMAGVSLPSQSSGPRSASGFKLPPNPAIPQDLSLIAEMVSSHQVVGALPPLSISAAEKRRLVEASMRSGKDKGKGREIEGVVPSPSYVKQVPSGEEGNDSDSDSDSSSEFLSDVDDEEADKPVPDKPMTATEHAEIKANLDRLVQATGTADDEDSDSSSEEDEEEGQGVAEFEFSSSPIPSPRGPKIPLDMMDDDEDLATGDPILSIHEVPLPPVPQPPVGKLPSGEAMSLAGDVVGWMKEKKVEAWVEREREQAQAQAQTQAMEKSNPEGELENASSQDLRISKGNEAEVARGDEMAEDGEVSDNKHSTTINPEQEPETSQESSAKTVKATLPSESGSVPRFNSAGTVVVRAMQERPGQEGWLEEGSVLCWSDGRVLGTVFDTNPVYRSFVNMQAVRDPRFKGSDASNIYDEEIGEDEIEWSDDEAEAEAKRRRKAKRGGSAIPRGGGRGGARAWAGSDAGGSTPRATQHSSLPQRPHFDFQPDDASDAGDAGSMYGDVPSAGYEGETWSDAGSTASGRGRPKPAPYELDDDMGRVGAGPTPTDQVVVVLVVVMPELLEGGEGAGVDQGDKAGIEGMVEEVQAKVAEAATAMIGDHQEVPDNAELVSVALVVLASTTLHAFQQQHPQHQQYSHQQNMGGYDPSNPVPLHPHQSNPPQFANAGILGMQSGQPQPGYPPNPSQLGQGQMQWNGHGHPASAAQGHGQWTTPPGFPQGHGDFGFQQQQQLQQQPSMPAALNPGGVGAVANAPAINPRFAAQYQQMFQGGYAWPGQQGQGNHYSE